jgi:hypothetical protein
MAQVHRPLIIQSQCIRLFCPRNAPRTLAFAQTRYRRRLHTATVTDNDIARLASLPLHPLTLADLVKYASKPRSICSDLLIVVNVNQTRTPSPNNPATPHLRKLHTLDPPCPAGTPHPITPQPALHCRLQSTYFEDTLELYTLAVYSIAMGREGDLDIRG